LVDFTRAPSETPILRGSEFFKCLNKMIPGRRPPPLHRPPEDALWLQDIEEQLDSLVRTAEQRWQRIAALLIEVEAQALWQGAATS
jgi:hypothetical protein